MKTLFRLSSLFLFLSVLVSCQSTSQSTVIAFNSHQDGFGGTGNKVIGDDGFGGTGIVGTITAFGSIWVNGVEVEYDQSTPIKSNISKDRVRLKIGQQVSLETKANTKMAIAEHISVYYPLAGKISSIVNNIITINKQTVYINKQTLFDEKLILQKGNYIAINALPNDKGGWDATRINHNREKHSFYNPEPPLDFSNMVKQLIIEESIMRHSDLLIFNNMPIHIRPSHLDGLRQMRDLKSMKESMETMRNFRGGYNPQSIKGSFHR